MQVRNKETGAIESLRYGAAMEAVSAGTHDIANEGQDKDPGENGKTAEAKPTPKSSDKTEPKR